MQQLLDRPADTAADQYLSELADKKQQLIDQFLEVLRKADNTQTDQ